MALSPIGNVTFINQNSQLGSVQHANNMQKVDFMLSANMQEFTDKLKAVQEVSPAPETRAIDPDDKQEKKREQEGREDSENTKDSKEAKDFEMAEDSLDEASKEAIACVGDEEVHLLDVRA